MRFAESPPARHWSQRLRCELLRGGVRDPWRRQGVQLALGCIVGLDLSGCAMRLGPPQPAPSTPTPIVAAASAPKKSVLAAGAAPPAVPLAAPLAAPTAAPSEPALPEGGAPVTPAVQRAFDAARQALAAGRTDEAERGFLALTRSNPELGGPHANLGLIYRKAGKTAQAVAALERAAQASPQQPVFFNQLGIAYREAGKFKQAQEAYERAIALDPGYAVAHLNLGILFDVYLWDSQQALASYDRYLALSPNGDDQVRKWVADLKNRKPPGAAGKKETS